MLTVCLLLGDDPIHFDDEVVGGVLEVVQFDCVPDSQEGGCYCRSTGH